MVVPLDSLQPSFDLPPLSDIPDNNLDIPIPGLSLDSVGPLNIPHIVFGAASFSNQYNGDDILTSDIPLRSVRLALRYGIRAFDTSAYYGPSEIVLGTVLDALRTDFPRSSYILMTKCGRYGFHKNAFDYRPESIRKSVLRSLSRLKTTYLDVVYLHDVEFVAEQVEPRSCGDHESALGGEAGEYGLEVGDEGVVRGPGDQMILDAIVELRKMKDEGLIRYIGITGYPLHTLLRLSILIKHQTSKPIDTLLSYSQSNLQNNTLSLFAPSLRERGGVMQVTSASPLNMGLFTGPGRVPVWHPAPEGLREAVGRVWAVCEGVEIVDEGGSESESREGMWPGGLVNIALGFAMRSGSRSRGDDDNSNEKNKEIEEEVLGAGIEGSPVVVGLSSPEEVHEIVKVWREIKGEGESPNVKDSDDVNAQLTQRRRRRLEIEKRIIDLLKESGYSGWAWESPPQAAKE